MKKVLILGSGSIALKHIKNLLELNYYVLVYTKNKSFDIKNTNIEKLHYINNIPKIHFAIIANKTSDHLKYIKLLIKKKYTFIVKNQYFLKSLIF